MSRSILSLKSFAALLFALAVAIFAPGSAFAQRGGHGGGHMGGGYGGHSGGFGGSHASGGSHSSSSGSSHSSGRTHSAPPATSTPPSSTDASASTTGNTVVHTPNFGAAASSDTAHSIELELRSEPAPTHDSAIGFPSTDSHIATASGVLSFSGQGHAIWQNVPASRATSESSESQRVLFGHPQGSATVHQPRPPHRVSGPPVSGPSYYYYPAFGFYPFGVFGNGFCDPFWGFDPAFGCNGFGFGYGYGGFGYGFGWGYPGGYFGGYNAAPDDSFSVGASTGPKVYTNDSATDDYGTFSAAPSLQQGTEQESAPAAAPTSPTTVIYMKDGTNLGVMSYWLDAGKLHYITNYGGENTIDIGQLDLQRTVDENARSGVAFTLKPAPPAPAAPATPQQAPAATPLP